MLPSRITRLVPLAAVLLAVSARAQTPAVNLHPCTEGGLPEGSRCGSISVPENRDAPGGRQLALNVVVVPSRAGGQARTAAAFFGGGPGQRATEMAGVSRGGTLSGLRDVGDLLFVDQRGTGGTPNLNCSLRDPSDPQSYLTDFIPPARAAACRDSLARFADLTRYTFPELAHDIEAVRTALGYEKLDLWGGSYGTRAALVYLRMYPARVRTAALVGVVPPSFLQPRGYARSTELALSGIFRECRANAACNAAFPNAEQELRTVAARLEQGPAQAEIMDPLSRRPVRLTLSRGTFAETVRKMLYSPGSARMIPFLVHRAHEGDYRPILRAALSDRLSSAQGSSWGLYLALTCTEDVPPIDLAEAARDNGRTLLGDYRVTQQAAACEGWPRGTVPAGYYEPVRSDVPVLLVSGELDPVTPASGGAEAAATLPNGLHVVIPGGAHGSGGMPGSECVDSMIVQFTRQGSVRGLPVDDCLGRIHSPPFTLDIPEPITLAPAALQRLAGNFANADSTFVVRVDPIENALHVHGEDFDFVAEPMSATLFHWEGLPPGYEIEFSADGSSATLRGPGEEPTHITRRP